MKGFFSFFILGFFILSHSINAQNSLQMVAIEDNQSPWSVSFSGGTSVFFGDVKQNPIFPTLINKSELRYVAAVGVERRLSPSFSLRGELSYSHVVGTRRAWNRHFQAFVYQSNLSLLLYPVNAIWGHNPNRIANLYLHAGSGIVNYNSTLYALDFGQVIRSSGYGNGRGIDGMTLGVVAVGGLGVDFPLSKRFDLKIELSQHLLLNDELDLVASGFKYDMYNQFSVGFKYHFGRSKADGAVVPERFFEQTEPIIEKQHEPEIKTETDDQWQSINQVIDIGEAESEIVSKETPEEVIEKTATEPEETIVKEKEYRVQILNNGRKPINLKELASRFNLNEADIVASLYKGMNIFTVGSFDSYEEALSYREIVKSVHGVHDAFVVPFIKGVRVAKMP